MISISKWIQALVGSNTDTESNLVGPKSIHLLNCLVLKGTEHTLYLLLHLESRMTNLPLVKLFIDDNLHLKEKEILGLNHLLHVT